VRWSFPVTPRAKRIHRRRGGAQSVLPAIGQRIARHLAREYFQENDFGLGTSYVVSGSPGSFLDQLIINFESSYVPGPDIHESFAEFRLYSQTRSVHGLGPGEVTSASHRASGDLHGISVDAQDAERPVRALPGRHGRDESNASTGSAADGTHWRSLSKQTVSRPRRALRFRPRLVMPPYGGILVQPAIRLKPSGGITVETFYNYLNSHLAGTQQRNSNHHR